jgi:hypothetical protein
MIASPLPRDTHRMPGWMKRHVRGKRPAPVVETERDRFLRAFIGPMERWGDLEDLDRRLHT